MQNKGYLLIEALLVLMIISLLIILMLGIEMNRKKIHEITKKELKQEGVYFD